MAASQLQPTLLFRPANAKSDLSSTATASLLKENDILFTVGVFTLIQKITLDSCNQLTRLENPMDDQRQEDDLWSESTRLFCVQAIETVSKQDVYINFLGVKRVWLPDNRLDLAEDALKIKFKMCSFERCPRADDNFDFLLNVLVDDDLVSNYVIPSFCVCNKFVLATICALNDNEELNSRIEEICGHAFKLDYNYYKVLPQKYIYESELFLLHHKEKANSRKDDKSPQEMATSASGELRTIN